MGNPISLIKTLATQARTLAHILPNGNQLNYTSAQAKSFLERTIRVRVGIEPIISKSGKMLKVVGYKPIFKETPAPRTILSDILEEFLDLSKTLKGENIVLNLSKEAVKDSSGSVIRTTISKGKEIIGRIASTVKGTEKAPITITGGNILGHSFHTAEKFKSGAELVQELAKKSGVDIRLASKRIELAKLRGINVKNQATLEQVINGKIGQNKVVRTERYNPKGNLQEVFQKEQRLGKYEYIQPYYNDLII